MVVKVQSRMLSRHPLEIALVLAMAISSAFQLVQGPAPGSLTNYMRVELRTVLFVTIIVCAAVTLVGAVLHVRRQPLASYVELAGISGIGFSTLALVIHVVESVPNWWLTPGTWTIFGVSAGFLVRAYQITYLLRIILRITAKMRDAESTIL